MAFEFNPPRGKPWLLYGLLGASLLLNVVMVLKGGDAEAPTADAAVAEAGGAEASPGPVDPNAPAVAAALFLALLLFLAVTALLLGLGFAVAAFRCGGFLAILHIG
jgi:hypothetical protein